MENSYDQLMLIIAVLLIGFIIYSYWDFIIPSSENLDGTDDSAAAAAKKAAAERAAAVQNALQTRHDAAASFAAAADASNATVTLTKQAVAEAPDSRAKVKGPGAAVTKQQVEDYLQIYQPQTWASICNAKNEYSGGYDFNRYRRDNNIDYQKSVSSSEPAQSVKDAYYQYIGNVTFRTKKASN